MQNQIEASQIALQNQISIDKRQGILQVARVDADVTKTNADTGFYKSKREADSEFYKTLKEAEGAAQASALAAEQEAKNIILLAQAEQKRIEMIGMAYDTVKSEHGRRMQALRIEVENRKVLPASTVLFEGAQSGSALADGYMQAQGYKFAGSKDFASAS